MNSTKHFQKRSRQRGISETDAEIVRIYGQPVKGNPDRLILTRKIWNEIPERTPELEQIEKKLPLCVVYGRGDLLVTAFTFSRRVSKEKMTQGKNYKRRKR